MPTKNANHHLAMPSGRPRVIPMKRSTEPAGWSLIHLQTFLQQTLGAHLSTLNRFKIKIHINLEQDTYIVESSCEQFQRELARIVVARIATAMGLTHPNQLAEKFNKIDFQVNNHSDCKGHCHSPGLLLCRSIRQTRTFLSAKQLNDAFRCLEFCLNTSEVMKIRL